MIINDANRNSTNYFDIRDTFHDDKQVDDIINIEHRIDLIELLLEAEKVRRLGRIADSLGKLTIEDISNIIAIYSIIPIITNEIAETSD